QVVGDRHPGDGDEQHHHQQGGEQRNHHRQGELTKHRCLAEKSECRNPKSETNSNTERRKSETKTPVSSFFSGFCLIRVLNLFRISDFDIRILVMPPWKTPPTP